MQKSKWDYVKQAPEKSCKSKTIPDQSKTIREIMLLHSRGITDVNTKVPQYHTEAELEILDGIDVRKLDIVEVNEAMDKIAQSLQEKHDNMKTKMEKEQLQEQLKNEERLKQQAIDDYKKAYGPITENDPSK